MAAWQSPKPKRRRWFQWSLRSLLFVMLLLGVGLGWLANELRKVRERKEVVELFEQRGGVSYDDVEQGQIDWLSTLLNDHPNRPSKNPWSTEQSPPKEKVWRCSFSLSKRRNVVKLSISGQSNFQYRSFPADDFSGPFAPLIELIHHNDLTNDELAGVRHLKHLKELYVDWTDITDEGLAHLSGLTELEQLGVSCTRITDQGLVHLRGLPKLKGLYLNKTNITGAGFIHFRDLKELQTLDVADTNVSDSHLFYLGRISSLRRVNLERTKVTAEGVTKLKKALPNLEIFNDFGLRTDDSRLIGGTF